MRATSHPSRRRISLLLALLAGAAATGCIPQTPYAGPRPDDQLRVHERGGGRVATGRLVRLSSDSVTWRLDAPAEAPARTVPLASIARLEVHAPLSQRDAFNRGALRGAIFGALLGGGVLAARNDAVGAAVGITLGSSWLGGVLGGQGAGLPNGPRRWRTVYPGPG